jgi:hypothetical protein
MGEIATWSAVKTKVGLGKDSNECPTKAELLALSPTGTGENYVGLEISNASSYGNNETVQLSDIHKVTYKYTFTVDRTTLSFPASGGAPSPNLWFGLVSRKQKYVDGVISGSYTEVGSTQTAYPDWVSYNQTVPQYEAKENTGLVERSANMTFTQNESGKQITVQFTQAAATSTWAYTFTLTKASSNSIGALGGKVTFEIDSYKQEIRNGHNYGSQIPVSYKRTDDPDSSEILEMTIPENKTESSRGFNYIWTQDESNKKQNYTVTQAAGVKTYGTPTVYLGNIADIPASGGTAATPTYTYSQLWGWNGKTNDGGTISSGASVVWSENISGSNLGTTVKARTKLGSRTLTVTLNGKSGSASIDIYQAENKITNTTQGAWEVSISANPSTFTEQGGTSQISASARAPRTNHWSSGATNAASDATGTPTLSIPTAVTGFSLSGTTLTVAENTTANQRSVVVRATMDTVYKEVTVTQSAYLVEWVYTMTTTQPTLNFDALGTMQTCTITSYREKYINGSLVEGSMEGVNIRVKSSNAYIASTGSPNIREITMFENKTTNSRVGEVVYEQYDSGKTQTITCNQAAGTVTTRDVLEVISNFLDAPAAMGTNKVKGSVKCGYYDVINGKDSTWHSELPTVKAKSSYITNVDIGRFSSTQIDITCTVSDNTSESSRRLSVDLTYGSKEIELACTQAGASVRYNYYFGVTTDFPSVAAAGATPKAVIKSRRHKVVNGVEESSYSLVKTSVISKPDWTGTLSANVSSTSGSGADYDVTIPVYENTEASIRRGTVVLQQRNSGKRLTLNLNQLAASITTRDYINYVEPIPDGMFSALAQSITVTLQSYRETLINGKVTSKVAVQPDFDLDSTVTDWASVDLIGGNPTNYEYDFEVSVKENTTNQIRSGSVMFYNGAAEVENGWAFTQDAASVSTSYDIYYRRRVNTGSPTSPNIVITDRVTEVELEGTVGSPSFGFVSMELIIEKIQTINGNPQTPVRISSEFVKTNNSVNSVPSGQLTSALASISEGDINDAIITIYNTVQNLAEYPRTHTVSFYKKDITLDGTVIGQTPDITVTVNPIPYTRVLEFGWKQEGSTITNITLDGDIYGSSAGSRDIISYASLRRNNVEFAKKYIKPTFIPPSEDWLQVIDNGQNSDNSYNWAFKALTNNEGDSARSQSVRFEQPGNGNQALYAYVSQDPRDEGYLGGRVNNNGPRTISLNTVKDENWVANTDIQSGNYYGLGTLAQDAITIETNIAVSGTDSSTYTQQVELSNLKFSKSGRPVTISNDPNQTTDYEYHWELYPSAGVPAGFTVNIRMLSSDGDNDNGIRLDIIKKNTTVFPIGTLIGTLTLTPKDPTKLPIITCSVDHRYFT